MLDKDRALTHLRGALGYKPLTPIWAKAEIMLGLLAAGLGLFLGNGAFHPGGDVSWLLPAAGILLFALGGYLALAGHRSHLYQSSNELAAYLAEEIRSTRQSPK